jgi:hypothetical protein
MGTKMLSGTVDAVKLMVTKGRIQEIMNSGIQEFSIPGAFS